MVSSRELCRDAASFFVYFSVFLHVFILNFVYSDCPKCFQCGILGNLSFPLADFSQPGCGLFAVECDALPYPRIHLDTERKEQVKADFIIHSYTWKYSRTLRVRLFHLAP
ncbi:unnamed protein product [Fraxinus pennsylvanica]|uniref:Uncharacterized protein n=1 Tax=Fraxinus pennsylvanica TaxID=56036 RepID=A0AAD2A5W7_9LAMI|nr:unnamed protein product [Fraxinus pennsylvanica]